MEVEFRVDSDHLSWDDPGIEPAIEEYTNPLWPFGRREKAQQALEAKQTELLEKHGIEEDSNLGVTVLKVDGVESQEPRPKGRGLQKTDLTKDCVLLQKKTQHSNEESCLAQEFVNCTYSLDDLGTELKYLSQVAYLI